uniref:Uncharacterized protein n=1 Tax=Anguilla anguilla TaxID=7936 RepID=A0A0E9V9U1_ANGAN
MDPTSRPGCFFKCTVNTEVRPVSAGITDKSRLWIVSRL